MLTGDKGVPLRVALSAQTFLPCKKVTAAIANAGCWLKFKNKHDKSLPSCEQSAGKNHTLVSGIFAGYLLLYICYHQRANPIFYSY